MTARKTLTLALTALCAAACGDATTAPDAATCDLLAELEAEQVSSNGISANKLTANRLTFNRLSLNKLVANRLTFNRLTFNRLTFNRLTFNRISLNRLSLNGAGAEAVDSVRDLARDPEGRETLTYLMRCALPEGDALAVEVDGELRQFPGLLGVAPDWLERGLTAPEERWLSACMLAHVNAFGVEVPISARAHEQIDADPVERAAFSLHEGAFFGSLAAGRWFSCHAEDPALARELSADRSRRVCTDEDETCPIVSVGACADVCATWDEATGWRDCAAEGETYDEVVNTFLREDALRATCAQ